MRPSWVIRPKAGSSWMPGDLLGGATPSYPQLLLRQVTAAVDATVHGHKALEGRPVPDVGVVEAGVEHDDGEGQDVAGVCGTQQRSESWPWPRPLLRPNPSGRRVGCLNALKVHPVLPAWHSSPSLTSHSSGAPCCKQASTVSCPSPCVPHTRHFCSCWAPCLARPFLPFSTHLNPPAFSLLLQPSSPLSPSCPPAHSVLCLLGTQRMLIVCYLVQGLVTCCLVILLALWGSQSQAPVLLFRLSRACAQEPGWAERLGGR